MYDWLDCLAMRESPNSITVESECGKDDLNKISVESSTRSLTTSWGRRLWIFKIVRIRLRVSSGKFDGTPNLIALFAHNLLSRTTIGFNQNPTIGDQDDCISF